MNKLQEKIKQLNEQKHKYELYTADFYANESCTTIEHIAYADTFEEAIEILASHYTSRDDTAALSEIRSHTEAELEGREEICLYGGCTYFREYLRKVPGYVDPADKQTGGISLAEVLCRELKDAGEEEWTLFIDGKDDEFQLRIGKRDAISLPNKYQGLTGLPGWRITDNSVRHVRYGSQWNSQITTIYGSDLGGIDWQKATAEEVEQQLDQLWLQRKFYFLEQEAWDALPDEIILYFSGKSNVNIRPYDQHGYRVVSISAHGGGMSDHPGVFVFISRKDQ